MSDNDTEQSNEGGEIAAVNNLEAQGGRVLTPREPEATSAAQEEVAAASPPVPADTKATLQMGTQMQPVKAEDRDYMKPLPEGVVNRQYADELVKAQPAKNVEAPASKRFIKTVKAGQATFIQAYDGESYAEFALEDVAGFNQFTSESVTHVNVMLHGGGGVHFTGHGPDVEDLMKAWRGVRSTQRR
jgi:hypothetical protein